jgi:hypothetical protein
MKLDNQDVLDYLMVLKERALQNEPLLTESSYASRSHLAVAYVHVCYHVYAT